MGKLRQVYWEFGTQAASSAVTVHSADLTAGNIVAQAGLRDTFIGAVSDVSLGVLGSMEWTAETSEVARTPSSDPAAQRENKWLVAFVDNVTGLGGRFTIPCYNSALLAIDGSEMEAGGLRTALISATEAFVQSNAGNAVTVVGIRFTARNLG